MASRVALITGGAQGLGRAFAEQILKKGGKVCLVDLDRQEGLNTEKTLSKQFGSGNVTFIECDVTSSPQLEDAFKKCKETYGKLNVVANNAGIGGEHNWRKMIDVNLTAVIHGTLLGFEYMRRDKGGDGGVIVNTSSLAGLYPQREQPVYTATKFGVLGLSRSFGAMLDYPTHYVRVNCLCPGFTDTRMVKAYTKVMETNPDPNQIAAFQIFQKTGLVSPSVVAEAFMVFVEDESKNGAVLRVTKQKGIEYVPYRQPASKI